MKDRRKKLILFFIVALIIWTSLSAFALETRRLDSEFLPGWDKANQRDRVTDEVLKLYFPMEIMIYILGLVFVYTIFYGWTQELYDGKIYKTIAYFILGIFGGLYSLNTYTLLGSIRSYLIGRGQILPIRVIFQPILTSIFMLVLSYGIRRSIEGDFHREAASLKGTDYYDSWIDMAEKIKNGI